jgi:sigma-B regulation protein RsbU (phosphoserine phosphatase)
MSLRVKFTLWMTVALVVVMTCAGFLLTRGASKVASTAMEKRLAEAVALTAKEGQAGNYEQLGSSATIVPGTGVKRFPVRLGLADGRDERAELYQASASGDSRVLHLLVPNDEDKSGRGLFDLILGITASVIAVGAVVSLIVAGSVARPIEGLVDDVRQIARGNLLHRTHVRVGGEVAALGREIDKMAVSLRGAQDAELELSAREREMEVADEVRESLLPEGTPDVPGYDLLALQIGSPTPGGDFYDVLEYDDGRVGLLVCEVSGAGIPGALIGATARAYLNSVLLRSTDVIEGLRSVNSHLAKGVRRGMYVTALLALLDPRTGKVEVACAGHKVPLLRYTAGDGKVRTCQPEGIALGFDRGPIFDRALRTTSLELEPGDRLIVANTGPLQVVNGDGEELGEKAFYRLVLKKAGAASEELLGAIENDLDSYAGEEDFPHDISIITIRRDA